MSVSPDTVSPEHISAHQPLPALPFTCRILEDLLPSALMVNGLLLLLFGITKSTSIISIISTIHLT
jgi:hypothetical protein